MFLGKSGAKTGIAKTPPPKWDKFPTFSEESEIGDSPKGHDQGCDTKDPASPKGEPESLVTGG